MSLVRRKGLRAEGGHGLNRREFLHTGLAGLAAITALRLRAAEEPAPKKRPMAAAFDEEIEAFMAARKVPGGALAVVKDGRLVYACGYGWANWERRISVKPDALFRIASLSKPFTAAAVLKLVEEKKLGLESRAFDIVKLKPLLKADVKPDARLAGITVRQLLQHTGGWDREKSFDPMFRPAIIARAVGEAGPARPQAVIRYMLGQPLDFDPGTRFAYSNFGYCVLGRVIEKVTGQSYEKFVQEKILAPIGIKRMRLGASLDGKQADGEVRYYTPKDETAANVFPVSPRKVPWPYGGFHLEAMDAHGGWIASAIDLARFAAALADASHRPLLRPETLKTMYAPPPPPVSREDDGSLKDYYYGCGWMVRPVTKEGKANYWHAGSLPGTSTLLVRRWDGLSWAVLFNQRSEEKNLPDGAIDGALHRAAEAVEKWPLEDLFAKWQFDR